MNKLPNKPSKLLKLALKDLKAVEADGRYMVDMEVYHTQLSEGVCSVCLAGAVMAFSLGAHREEGLSPRCFPGKLEYKLEALDHFRAGSILGGLRALDIEIPHGLSQWVNVTPYQDSTKEFKKGMKKIIKLLKKAGL